MKWYLATMTYRIVCGDGAHIPQFDEQYRLIMAGNEKEAFDKATAVGKQEEEVFLNSQKETVKWEFVGITELAALKELRDGMELVSRVAEHDDVYSYLDIVKRKAADLEARVARLPVNH